MIKKTSALIVLLGLFSVFSAQAQAIKSGLWRFEMSSVHAKIPFIIELEATKRGLKGKLHNGKEIIPLTGIKVRAKNISIPLQNYENSLELTIKSPTELTGNFVRHNKSPKVEYPVEGVHGISERFPGDRKSPERDFTGKWAVTMSDAPDSSHPGIVVFEQKGNTLTGTILTPTGDYRYFEGYVSGKEFEVASFDGVYNYLFSGKIERNQLEGSLRSTIITSVKGNFDPKAELPDAYKQTQLESMSFTFPDVSGKQVSLSDERFKGKPVIVTFFGSWCPNCIDEMNYLIPWYNQNASRGVEVVALSFERSLNEAEAKRQLKKVQVKSKVPYPLLLAGSTSQDKPTDKIKGLKNFISFPTTVFLNKKHEVVKVHAGFNGPSTGEYFEQWKKEFNATVDELLK